MLFLLAHDLADLLNVPTRALSLAGKLSLAFGARGKGTAAAHYEPSRVVINLTKTQGAGSLAHEWFHALDNYFGRTRLAEIAERKGAKADNEFITKAPLVFYVKGDQLISAEHFEDAIAAGRPTADNFKQTARHRLTWQHIGESVAGWTKLETVRPEVLHAFEQVVTALNQSPMKARAIKADKGKEGYWSQIVERAARAFENYVIASLAQKGQRNDYLANVTAFEDFSRDESLYPYLKADELAPISQAFDNLFSTLKTRTDDQGNVALTIYFHNPDTTPNKINPNDELVSWKWLLNKKDITIVVAPEQGKDKWWREKWKPPAPAPAIRSFLAG